MSPSDDHFGPPLFYYILYTIVVHSLCLCLCLCSTLYTIIYTPACVYYYYIYHYINTSDVILKCYVYVFMWHNKYIEPCSTLSFVIRLNDVFPAAGAIYSSLVAP
jgi:hypothetical protein